VGSSAEFTEDSGDVEREGNCVTLTCSSGSDVSQVEGTGKGGFVNGSTDIKLAETVDGTEVSYDGNINIGGTIARIGQRLVEAAAKMLLNQGFKALKKKIEERANQENA